MNQTQDGLAISFYAMASPCEILFDSQNERLADTVASLVTKEVWRIEDKYSRYNANSLCSEINTSQGLTIAIDNETYLLLNFADQCFQLSEGLFDITSGVLRQAWHFDGSDIIPHKAKIDKLLKFVGWHKIEYDQKSMTLPAGMEIDFGGLGKEYAVDRCIQLIKTVTQCPVLVNLGGDLCATDTRKNNESWQIGIEHPGFVDNTTQIVKLKKGALATSGDAKRYLLKNGKRYSHILNAITGWPVENAPRSMTVAAPQCIQAGILATLALLQGNNAENFLDEQEIKYWAIR